MSVTQERADVAGRLLTGWGRTAPSRARVVGPMEPGQLRDLVAAAPAQGVLARGAGRSYGDAAQNAGGYVLDPATEPHVDLDADAATVRAAGSTTFTELLTRIVPHGLLLPVLPGTRHVTVGGAVAADVHGRNQRSDGSIGSWIEEIELLDGTGEVRRLTPGGDGEAFRATVGGMGLTGIILAARIRLLRVRSALMRVTTRRLANLDALLGAIDEAGDHYSVAWVDTTATGRSFGRGILSVGDHLAEPDPAAEAGGLAYRPSRGRRAPQLPVCPLTSWSAREFNGLHFFKAPQEDSEITDLAAFFHRLDAIDGWNRVMGPHGFVQYQFVVPEGAHEVIARVLEAVQRHRLAPFLGTIKRFGAASGGHLSFPLPGWSLAIDMPAGNRRLGPVLNELDQWIAAEGGRVYLAKDSRLSASAFEAMYPQLPQWRAARSRLDPAGVFRSDLGRRLGLC
ncbi:MAG TPA: FAD-binding oxidoreductase [Streptosporangiaceae bacterium]|nr:FAD-binding oxidoreductase [Streptosporangiaceae bacterium]